MLTVLCIAYSICITYSKDKFSAFMARCPHCNIRYDETNETQPCCYKCGHPISCGCSGGHSYSTPSPSPSPVPKGISEDSGQESVEEENGGGEPSGETFSTDGDLPF